MNKHLPFSAKTTLRQKITLVTLSVLFTFLILELGLRLGGFIILSSQEYQNLASIKKRGEYRIVCLGESTTQNQYPSFLEEILNQRNLGIKFSVIDKGQATINTSFILSRLESDLDAYQPQMVVAMMGINDWGVIQYYENILESPSLFFKHSRTYRFFRTLWMHIINKLRKTASLKPLTGSSKRSPSLKYLRDSSNSQEAKGALTLDSLKKSSKRIPEEEAYVRTGFSDCFQGNISQAEQAFQKALRLNPRNEWAYAGLGYVYQQQGNYPRAEETLQTALASDYGNDMKLEGFYRHQDDLCPLEQFLKKEFEINSCKEILYLRLGRLYRKQGNYPQAEQAFQKVLELNPRSEKAYLDLGRIYQDQGNYPQAEQAFQKVLKLKPRSEKAYTGLGYVYQQQGNYPQAEQAFQKALHLNPRNDEVYVGLGWLYRSQGDLSKVEACFQKALQLNPRNEWAYAGLGYVYRQQGKYPQAEQAFQKALRLKPQNEVIVVLGDLYFRKDNLSQVEKICRIAFQGDIRIDDRLQGLLSSIFREKGDYESAEEYLKKTNELRMNSYSPLTFINYRRLKEILDRRGIRLVCVQYPMRNVASLKKIFEGDNGGIIFVENEKIFKDAVNKEGQRAYFIDMFGGDFGHCTGRGNRLLAQNIADAIIKEVFRR